MPEGQRLLDTFQDAKVQVSNGFVRIFPSNSAFEPLIFLISAQGLDFAGSLPAGVWRYHPPTKNWIGWSGQRAHSLKKGSSDFWKDESEPTVPRFLVLGPSETEARDISGLVPSGEVRGRSIFYHPEPIVIVDAKPALLRSETGIMVFDGEQTQEKISLLYETIGNHPSISTLGKLDIIQSEQGVFVLHDDLSVRRIDTFPVEKPWPHKVSIDYVEAWDAYIVIDMRSGNAFFSEDMQRFTNIDSKEHITGVVGILPQPASVLAIGEQLLIAITQECNS